MDYDPVISHENHWERRLRQREGPASYSLRSEHEFVRPPNQDAELLAREVRVERKAFMFTLKENPRGRFLRITEDAHGRYNSIIIPASGLKEFQKMIHDLAEAAQTLPSVSQTANPQKRDTGADA